MAGKYPLTIAASEFNPGDVVPEPALHELTAFVKAHGASEASRHYGMGYSAVRRRIRSVGLKLKRGQRRNIALAARNAEIRILRMQGHYLINIGKAFNVGRERIRQILAATGGDPLQDGEALPLPEDLKSGVIAATKLANNAVTPTPAKRVAQLEPSKS